MKNSKNISGNSLEEMRTLLGKINELVDKDYKHVKQYLNKQFLFSLEAQTDTIEMEVQKREDKLW
jgi:hypothetical protein